MKENNKIPGAQKAKSNLFNQIIDRSKNAPKGVSRILTQKQAVWRNIDYVRKRASGEIVPLKTSYELLNRALGGGIELNTMMTISGLSGGGKSSLSKRIVNGINQNLLNIGRKCLSLSFNFEMLAHKTIGREIANLNQMSLKELYSSEHPLAASKIDYLINTHYKTLMQYPIMYVEEPIDHVEIGNTIYYYWKELCKDDNTVLIVEVDHAVITRGKQGDNQKDKIDNLMETLNRVKKKISNEGGEVFFIILSQMNRDIKKSDRISDPAQHYPITSDLFASSSIEFFSDYILVTHMPYKLHLPKYTDQGFPIRLYNDKKLEGCKEFIYWHLLKNRDGEPDMMIPLLNNLKYFDFEEVQTDQFKKYLKQFNEKGHCYVH